MTRAEARSFITFCFLASSIANGVPAAFASGSSVSPSATNTAPVLQKPKTITHCCSLEMKFFVNNRQVDHSTMLVFDHKDRRIRVSGAISAWYFVFRIEPDVEMKQVTLIADVRASGTLTGESDSMTEGFGMPMTVQRVGKVSGTIYRAIVVARPIEK